MAIGVDSCLKIGTHVDIDILHNYLLSNYLMNFEALTGIWCVKKLYDSSKNKSRICCRTSVFQLFPESRFRMRLHKHECQPYKVTTDKKSYFLKKIDITSKNTIQSLSFCFKWNSSMSWAFFLHSSQRIHLSYSSDIVKV